MDRHHYRLGNRPSHGYLTVSPEQDSRFFSQGRHDLLPEPMGRDQVPFAEDRHASGEEAPVVMDRLDFSVGDGKYIGPAAVDSGNGPDLGPAVEDSGVQRGLERGRGVAWDDLSLEV